MKKFERKDNTLLSNQKVLTLLLYDNNEGMSTTNN